MMRDPGYSIVRNGAMSLRVTSALALGVLLGCASQSSLMDVKFMSDENLISYYHGVEADIVARQKELEKSSKSGRVIPSAISQDKLNALLKRKYRVQGEVTRRGLPSPDKQTPDGGGSP